MTTEVHNTSYAESRAVAEAGRETEWHLPSFGRELFLGSFRLDLISPQPRLDEAERSRADALIAEVTSWLAASCDSLEIERTGVIPQAVLQGAMERGLLGIKIPQEYGGLGFGQYHYNRVLGAVSTHCASLAVLLSAHQSIGLPEPLKGFGSPEQCREWLPKVASDHISAFLLTEPDVGSDPARVAASAIPTPDGSGYLLSGQKLWATNGTVAKVFVVMARVPKSEGHRGGITAFIVPADAPGVSTLARNEFMGLRGIENSLTEFRDVFVPAGNVILAEGKGLKIALTTLNTGRLSIPALCLASSKYCLKMAREFGAGRHQWGQPVGKHDAVAQKLAFITGSTFGLEALVDVSSRLADDKRNDIRIEAAIAKLYGAELSWRVADEMVQVRGGRGYETAGSLKARGELPYPAEQLLRDARINRIFEGSSEVMRLLIARDAVDQHLSAAGDILEARSLTDYAKAGTKASKFYAGWLPRLMVGEGMDPRSYAEFGALAKHLRYVERTARKLARETFYLMARYQGSLEQKGHLLGRVVDIGAELYAVACAVVYAQTIGAEHPERAQSAQELADLFCHQARRRAEDLLDQLWHNDDALQYEATQRLLSGRYLWFEEDIADPVDPDGLRPPTLA